MWVSEYVCMYVNFQFIELLTQLKSPIQIQTLRVARCTQCLWWRWCKRSDSDAENPLFYLRYQWTISLGQRHWIHSWCYQEVPQRLGLEQRLSSSFFPHSNHRSELGVKSAKRMLKENVSPAANWTQTSSCAPSSTTAIPRTETQDYHLPKG